jgi:hypothetical protein
MWSYFKMDIQGVFGISGYVITADAILTSLAAIRAGKV